VEIVTFDFTVAPNSDLPPIRHSRGPLGYRIGIIEARKVPNHILEGAHLYLERIGDVFDEAEDTATIYLL
jgi:hypothetical protein